jgi:hypothetical protein
MERGDYFQYPKKDRFKVPKYYNDEDEDTQKDLFWVRIMQPHQPFEFAKDKKLRSKPICWTSKPAHLSRRLDMPVETIEETQKTLLYHSLLNSFPVRPYFLEEYEKELTMTANHLRNLEKIPIVIDEVIEGINFFTVEINAIYVTDKVDADSNNRVNAPNEHEELLRA